MNHTRYSQFMHGFEQAAAPFDREIDRLREAEQGDEAAEGEAYERLIKELIVANRHREIAIAEYAGIPSTRVALAELHSATCGSRSSAYAYKVLDDLPDDYCAD